MIGCKTSVLETLRRGEEPKIESKILEDPKTDTSNLAKEQLKFIFEALDNPKELQLVFRASENGYSAAAFHKACNSVPNTLTILKTEFGKTLAGYVEKNWDP